MLFALIATGCIDQGLYPDKDAFGKGPLPRIGVNPQVLSFGELEGDEMETLTFVVDNFDGEADSMLLVERLYLKAPESSRVYGFALLDDDEADIVQGESRTYRVSFRPEIPALHEAEIVVESNDEGSPTLPVLLDGYGLVPQLSISPNPLNMGTVNKGCDRENQLTLTNVGTSELTITQIAHTGEGYDIAPPSLPITLAVGGTAPVGITFTPDAERAYNGTLSVTSDELIRTREAFQTAEGHIPTSYVDRFEIPSDPETDILFFVDPSASMADDQEQLANNFLTFVGSIATYSSNWQVMVVNSDDGCGSEVLTIDTPDYQGKFAAAVSGGDPNGRYAEAGLIVSQMALEQTGDGQCNDGFLRPNALLHIIAVSDEPEQSPYDWTTYIDWFRSLKSNPEHVKFSAVAGPLPSGCDWGGNTASAGTGYNEAVAATGGVFLPLCSSWADSVQELADATITEKRFKLSVEPYVPSIVVEVDGVVSNQWTYDETTNEVVFRDGFEPHEGQVIDVAYDEPLTCD